MITIAELFCMLVNADGHLDVKELEMGRRMAASEGFDIDDFDSAVENLVKSDKISLYEKCIGKLKTISLKDQTRYLAWMCLIANADGFMDSLEWELIYKIYHVELGLNRQSILDYQLKLKKELQLSVVIL